MNRIPVRSSDIRSIGYYAPDRILEIEFIDSGVYQYAGVPQTVYTALMSASSHGKYFHAHIKDVYRYLKIR